jgi:hypothetical protein
LILPRGSLALLGSVIKKRAQDLGVKVTTVVSRDEQYDYGREKWELIVLSWIGPLQVTRQIIEGLKPGGLVVVEGRQEWFGINGLLKAFSQLRVLDYEDTRAARISLIVSRCRSCASVDRK